MGIEWAPASQPAPPGDPLSQVPRPRAVKAGRTADPPSLLEQVACRVRAEYLEMPGLSLTREQARCLWNLDRETCDRVLAHLVDTGFLTRTSHQTYVRAGG